MVTSRGFVFCENLPLSLFNPWVSPPIYTSERKSFPFALLTLEILEITCILPDLPQSTARSKVF